MQHVEYYPQLVINIYIYMYKCWLILQNRIIIPVERIFMDKVTWAPGALMHCNNNIVHIGY